MRARLTALIASVIKRQLLPRGLFRATRVDYARVSGREAAVLMCLWNRPYRIDDILAMYDGQTGVSQGIVLYLWNNKRSDQALYEEHIRRYRATGALRGVRIVRSPFNLGSVARFYWASRFVARGRLDPVIVVDDDEDVEPEFVQVALDHAEPHSASGWWSFRLVGGYWRRRDAAVGDRIDHMGPGGIVCDPRLFDRSFFADFPDRFWFLDDIWFTYRALAAGFSLRKLPVTITLTLEETNQYHSLVDLKTVFYDSLYDRRDLSALPQLIQFDPPAEGSISFVQSDEEADIRYTMQATATGEWLVSAEYDLGAPELIGVIYRDDDCWVKTDAGSQLRKTAHDTWRDAVNALIADHDEQVQAALERRRSRFRAA